MNPNSETPPPLKAKQRKRQFSLAGILILVVILCPAFVAIREVVNIVNGGHKDWNLGIILFVLAYSFALTFIAFRRRRLTGADQNVRTLFWCVGRGGLFGIIYFVLLVWPVAIAEHDFLVRGSPWMFLFGLPVMGLSFGAPAGAAVWVVMRCFPALEAAWSARSLSGRHIPFDLSDRIATLVGQGGGMETLFTTQACEAMELAELEARKLNCDYFGTDHLLLGALSAGKLATTVLINLNVRVETIRDEMTQLVPPNPSSLSPIPFARGIPFTPTAKRAIENAFAEAQPLQEGGRRIDVGDLLIGLLREQEGVAAQFLLNHGVSLAELRLEIERANGQIL